MYLEAKDLKVGSIYECFENCTQCPTITLVRPERIEIGRDRVALFTGETSYEYTTSYGRFKEVPREILEARIRGQKSIIESAKLEIASLEAML